MILRRLSKILGCEMKNSDVEELRNIFKALDDSQLSSEMVARIKELLGMGQMKYEEAEFVQGLRRDAAAGYLGMTRKQYERFLDGENVKGRRKIDDKKTIREFLCMGEK